MLVIVFEEGRLVCSGLVVIEGFLDLCEAVEFVGDELFRWPRRGKDHPYLYSNVASTSRYDVLLKVSQVLL